MGKTLGRKVGMMTDDGKIISLRMGTEDLQMMDDFLEGHPELGGRSLFIRTAVRQYIDRDADVSGTGNRNEVTIRFSSAELETIDSMVDDGIFIDRADAVRAMIRTRIVDETRVTELVKSKFGAAATSLR